MNNTMNHTNKKPLFYSLSLHFILLAAIIIATLYHQQNFFFGTAVRSPQQVQIVNATLVLPQPSMSKVITPTPPAPTSIPTPPTPKPTEANNVKQTTPKPLPQAKVEQKPQKPEVEKQSAQQLQAIQKLKSLGLSSIQQAVDSNQKEAAAAAQAAEMLAMEQKYMGLIQQTIKSNWINQFDPNAQLTAILKITLDKNGNVLNVIVTQSSGNAAFDRQAILAVQKSSPLPLPPDPALAKKFMNLTLPFNNQDLQS
jgi:colicin import membrane protein